MGEDNITLVLVESSKVTCFANRSITLLCGFLPLEGSSLSRGSSHTVADLVWIGTGSECHDTTFCSPVNIPYMYQSIKDVPKSIPTAKCLTIPNQTFMCKLLIHTKRRLVSSSVTGSFIALRNLGIG